jgi:hypothetical protein
MTTHPQGYRKLIMVLIMVLLALVLAGCAPGTPSARTRSLVATPVAPVVVGSVVNAWTSEDGLLTGRDAQLRISHADLPGVDEFEVWHSETEPYFVPLACAACALITSTTALSLTVAAPGQTFNPVCGEGGTPRSDFDFYQVRASNAAGASGSSNTIGVVTWSLDESCASGMIVQP